MKLKQNFLQLIAGVVLNSNISSIETLLSESIVQYIQKLSNFTYIALRTELANFEIPTVSMRLPLEYQDLIRKASLSIKDYHKSRQLNWIHHLASVEFILDTKPRVTTIHLSLAQFIVFSFIHEHPQTDIQKIRNSTEIDNDYLESILSQLINSKIIEHQNGVLSFNVQMKSPKAVKPTIVLVDSWSPPPYTSAELENSRKNALKSIIVKIMKRERVMKIQFLIQQVINEAQHIFPAKAIDVHQAISVLCHNDYLSQNEDDDHVTYID